MQYCTGVLRASQAFLPSVSQLHCLFYYLFQLCSYVVSCDCIDSIDHGKLRVEIESTSSSTSPEKTQLHGWATCRSFRFEASEAPHRLALGHLLILKLNRDPPTSKLAQSSARTFKKYLSVTPAQLSL